MRSRIIIITTISGLVLTSILLALPQQDNSLLASGRGMFPRLDLSTEQLQAINEMRLEFQKEILPINNELKSKQLELQSIMISGDPDQKEINSIIDEMGKLQAEIQKKQVAHRLAIRDQLSDEQKAIWDAMPAGPRMRGMGMGDLGGVDQPQGRGMLRPGRNNRRVW